MNKIIKVFLINEKSVQKLIKIQKNNTYKLTLTLLNYKKKSNKK